MVAPTFREVLESSTFGANWRAEIKAEGEAMGEARGRTEGKAMGREEGRAEVARNALAQGATPEFVQKITGLDMQTITSFK
jgi:predicted transposase YdaD